MWESSFSLQWVKYSDTIASYYTTIRGVFKKFLEGATENTEIRTLFRILLHLSYIVLTQITLSIGTYYNKRCIPISDVAQKTVSDHDLHCLCIIQELFRHMNRRQNGPVKLNCLENYVKGASLNAADT